MTGIDKTNPYLANNPALDVLPNPYRLGDCNNAQLGAKDEFYVDPYPKIDAEADATVAENRTQRDAGLTLNSLAGTPLHLDAQLAGYLTPDSLNILTQAAAFVDTGLPKLQLGVMGGYQHRQTGAFHTGVASGGVEMRSQMGELHALHLIATTRLRFDQMLGVGIEDTTRMRIEADATLSQPMPDELELHARVVSDSNDGLGAAARNSKAVRDDGLVVPQAGAQTYLSLQTGASTRFGPVTFSLDAVAATRTRSDSPRSVMFGLQGRAEVDLLTNEDGKQVLGAGLAGSWTLHDIARNTVPTNDDHDMPSGSDTLKLWGGLRFTPNPTH